MVALLVEMHPARKSARKMCIRDRLAGVPYDAHETLADGKGKWWEGYDPRLLYGIDLRAYKDVANVKYRPEKGIFQDHLGYANWYATRWALRIEDVISKYDPDFIYTDGDSTQPFTGIMTGTGYKCDCMPVSYTHLTRPRAL